MDFVRLLQKDWGHHFNRTSAHALCTGLLTRLCNFSHAHKLVCTHITLITCPTLVKVQDMSHPEQLP